MKKAKIRSPFFYVGDKYKIMPQIIKLMPADIDTYVEPFVGGGSSFLNVNAKKYLLNDIDSYVIKLHKFISEFSHNPQELFDMMYREIENYGLSCSYKGIHAPDELKRLYVKTYYARYNKEGYIKMRDDFNKNQNDYLKLYLLLIYGFNHMIRFNNSGKFNLPVGNVDLNKNVYNALEFYLDFMSNRDIEFYNYDYKEFMNMIPLNEKSYVFLDPPYLISMSEYNKLWNDEKENELYEFLDAIDEKGIKFGITNLIFHKNRENLIFHKWCKKYDIYDINSNYISYNDNSIKDNSKEVFVTNFKGDFNGQSIS